VLANRTAQKNQIAVRYMIRPKFLIQTVCGMFANVLGYAQCIREANRSIEGNNFNVF